jgi:hypothetical protein
LTVWEVIPEHWSEETRKATEKEGKSIIYALLDIAL